MTTGFRGSGRVLNGPAGPASTLQRELMSSQIELSPPGLSARHCLAYETFGRTYAATRTTDPRVARAIHSALGGARSVLNVGAGTGSYEPVDRNVLAVEPSETMVRQRPRLAAPVLRARAEKLPLADASVDAAMALMTLHHWENWRSGVREMLRVTRNRVVVWTFDPDAIGSFWLVRDYFPEIVDLEKARCPPLEEQVEALGAQSEPLPIPRDCVDGVLACYWARPEAYLDESVRAGISLFHVLDTEVVGRGLRRLAKDLRSGAWERRNGKLSSCAALDVGYRLLVAPRTTAVS